MPTSFSHIDLCLVTLPLPLLQLLQNCYHYFCHCYHYYHTTLLLNTLLQILSYPGVVELTTQLLILNNILWLPLCRINKFGLNTLPSKVVAIPYTCGLSASAPWCLVPTKLTFLVVSYFPNFLDIPKLTKNIFADFSESVYLPYHVPLYVHDYGVFRKDSFMCSSGAKVWIILLSTLMGVPQT